jgi:DNA-binding MarR family transcriptional regulator
VTNVRWLDAKELQAWKRLLLMHLQLTATLSRELAEASGLSYQDYLVLAALTDRADGRMRAFELGRELGWEKSRLSHHIARMVERGLVRREKCETDQRGAFVVVSKKGRKAIEAAAPGHVEGVRRHFIELLSPAELDTLRWPAECWTGSLPMPVKKQWPWPGDAS